MQSLLFLYVWLGKTICTLYGLLFWFIKKLICDYFFFCAERKRKKPICFYRQHNKLKGKNLVQQALSISANLEHLSVSEYLPGRSNISTKYILIIFSPCPEPLYVKLLSISNKRFGAVPTALSLSGTFYLHVL